MSAGIEKIAPEAPRARSVLLVGSFPAVETGAFSPCEGLAQALGGAGWNVITTSRRAGRLPRLMDMSYTTFSRRRDYAVAQVDVFSGRAFFWAEAVCGILRELGKPFVLALHGGNLPTFAREAGARVKRLLWSAAAVTTPSRYLQEELRSVRGDLLLVPNALPLKAFRFRVRRRAGPRLVWVRAFHRTYNPTLAVRVVTALAPEFPDISLTMLGRDKGDGSLEETRDLASRFGVLDRLVLPGGVPNDEIPLHLDQHDVFLNTTNVDNTPVSVLEAMASGLCVVTTDVGGIPYLLSHGEDALLVPRDDAAAMAHEVRRVLIQPGLSERLSTRGRERVMGFDWSAVLPTWERLFLDARRGPA